MPAFGRSAAPGLTPQRDRSGAIYALGKEWPLRRHTDKAGRETASAGAQTDVAPM